MFMLSHIPRLDCIQQIGPWTVAMTHSLILLNDGCQRDVNATLTRRYIGLASPQCATKLWQTMAASERAPRQTPPSREPRENESSRGGDNLQFCPCKEAGAIACLHLGACGCRMPKGGGERGRVGGDRAGGELQGARRAGHVTISHHTTVGGEGEHAVTVK